MTMTSTSARARLATLAAAFLTGCSISTPQRVQPLSENEDPDARVYVSITRARVQPGHRVEFDLLTRKLHATLEGQPGLISHSIRREIFGLQAWTLTAWSSEEARDRFFQSPLHLQAVTAAARVLAEVKVRRLTLRRNELPLSWSRALELLEAEPELAPARPAAQTVSSARLTR